MHHYGVSKVDISDNNFKIILKNKITQAELTISGPLQGLLEEHKYYRFTRSQVEDLANMIAQFFMENLRV